MTTDADLFKRSIHTLLYFGQLPVITLPLVLVYLVQWYYGDGVWNTSFGNLFLAAFLSVLFAFAAVTSTRQHWAVVLLVVSLLLSISYLHFLIRLTGSAHSPFQHLYLYMPAVVLMVTHNRRWAEIATSVLVLVSYLVNYYNDTVWGGWASFERSPHLAMLENGFFIVLLILLICINWRMERVRILQHEQTTKQ